MNPRSGDASPDAEKLAAEAKRRGVAVHVLAALALEAAFVCVPFGTRNHFARDVGLDRDDAFGALDAFTHGVERRIDVGRANERIFVNNVSLGVYAGLVHRRERHRRRGEALARARALLAVARRRRRLPARVNGERVLARTIFVGNNRYELDLFTLGTRDRLDEGRLFLWIADGVLPTAWHERTGERFRIELGDARIAVAVDGEPAFLEPPLELEVVPRALRLRVPEREARERTRRNAMHDNPEPSEHEQEQAQEGRQQEEESMRYPEHHDPEEQQRRAHRERED